VGAAAQRPQRAGDAAGPGIHPGGAGGGREPRPQLPGVDLGAGTQGRAAQQAHTELCPHHH